MGHCIRVERYMAAVRRAVLRLPEPESDPETDAEEFGPEMEAAYDTMVRRWLATAALLTTFAAIAASLVVTTYSKSSDNIATSDNNMTTTSTLTTTEIIRTITSTAASTTIGTGDIEDIICLIVFVFFQLIPSLK